LGDANGSWGDDSGGLNLLKESSPCSQVRLSIPQQIEFQGDYIKLPVVVKNVECSLQTFVFSLGYNKQLLEFQSAKKTDLSDNFMIVSNGNEAGKVHVAMTGIKGVTIDGAIVTLAFKRKNAESFVTGTGFEITRAIINDVNVGCRQDQNVTLAEATHKIKQGQIQFIDNYPNPFNPSTTISFNLTKDAPVTINIFNTLGQKIATVFDGRLAMGQQTFIWNAVDGAGHVLPSGIYFCQIQIHHQDKATAKPIVMTKKMVLIQ